MKEQKSLTITTLNVSVIFAAGLPDSFTVFWQPCIFAKTQKELKIKSYRVL